MISRILLVDDDADICEVVTLALGLDPTVVVRSCGSGGEAPAIAVAWTPHLILCDVMMPIMDGPATLTALRKCKRTVKIPVVFMTASAQPREVEHLMSLGANGVITKPFDPMMLPNSLRCQLGACEPAGFRAGFPLRMLGDAVALHNSRDKSARKYCGECHVGVLIGWQSDRAFDLFGPERCYPRRQIHAQARELLEQLPDWRRPGVAQLSTTRKHRGQSARRHRTSRGITKFVSAIANTRRAFGELRARRHQPAILQILDTRHRP
jgi:CheY-like chemotaxis protein